MRIIPRHSLDDWTRCHRKWYYKNKLGLLPKEDPENIIIGNMVHAGLAAGYRRLYIVSGESIAPWYGDHNIHFYFLSGVRFGLDRYMLENPASQPFRVLAEDMCTYWWYNQGVANVYDEIIAIEETFYLEIGDKYLVPWTADLIARRPTGQLVIVDHKTVGNVRDAVGFLPMDFQMRRYAAGGFQKFVEIPEIDYNMIRRELPPSFRREDGVQPYGLTPSGRPSTRSSNPADYLQFHRLLFTPKQITATMAEIEGDIADMEHAEQTKFYARSEIKGGYNGCPGCPYFGPCTREFDGNKLDGITLALQYTKDPEHEKTAA